MLDLLFPHNSTSPYLYFTCSLSPLHLPHSLPLASSSPMGFFPPCLFISLTSSSPMGFFLTFSSPKLIAPSISYLNSPLPTAPTIGDGVLEFFFLSPVLLWWIVYERCNIFPLLLFDWICGFCGMCYY
jgi:hypothetical protein